MHLALWYVVLVCHQYDVCENYVGGYGGLRKSGLCVFCKWCPFCFLVVGKGPSVLVMMFVVVWCLALWLGCLCLVLCGPSC